MFDSKIYAARRAALRRRFKTGVILLVGNSDAPMNYAHNTYPFIQDGSFNYFFGLLQPDLAGVIDVDSGEDWLFGSDHDIEDVVWTGPLPTLADRALRIGVTRTWSLASLADWLQKVTDTGRSIHYPPPYRFQTRAILGDLLNRPAASVASGASSELVREIVALREIKGAEEVDEMESALEVTARMHLCAMASTRPGVYEYEVVGKMEGILRGYGLNLAYPIIFSRRGEVLHNTLHNNRLEAGDLVVNDSGASSTIGYASDITRTLPVGGRFNGRQREIYDIVYDAQRAAIAAARRGVLYADLHKLAAKVLVEGLISLGLFRGDPWEIVETGAYAIILQAGLGHQIGLDVHDMEALGEDAVGYDDEIKRSLLFGMNRLRLGKRLRLGMAVTVEPGIYFIPQLIDWWRHQGKFTEFINYDRVGTYANFGGVRIEDDVLVTIEGARILGPPIPSTAAEVEDAMDI